jgi:putative membrane protein
MSVKLGLLALSVSALLSTALAFSADRTEQGFVKESIQGNLAEVQVGHLAQQKGASQGVKDFGAMLVKDHSAANDKAQQAAAAVGVTAPSQHDMKQKAVYQELSALSGKEFDRHFIQSMVKDHQEDIAKYEKESNSGSGPAADYAKAILPDLRKHLEMAQSLQQQERTASSAAASKSRTR